MRGMIDKMIKLKKCPFCGGEASLTNDIIDDPFVPSLDTTFSIYVQCDECEAAGRAFVSVNHNPEEDDWETEECYAAACAWNMRNE